MSKYDEYLKCRDMVARVKASIRRSCGYDSSGKRDFTNDKATCRFYYKGLANDTFSPAKIWLEMVHGYYGSSSAYSDMDDNVAHYMTKACNAVSSIIAEKALELAQKDLDVAQQAAQQEAQSVLIATQEGSDEL